MCISFSRNLFTSPRVFDHIQPPPHRFHSFPWLVIGPRQWRSLTSVSLGAAIPLFWTSFIVHSQGLWVTSLSDPSDFGKASLLAESRLWHLFHAVSFVVNPSFGPTSCSKLGARILTSLKEDSTVPKCPYALALVTIHSLQRDFTPHKDVFRYERFWDPSSPFRPGFGSSVCIPSRNMFIHPCWCPAGNEAVTPINHPLSFPFRGPMGSIAARNLVSWNQFHGFSIPTAPARNVVSWNQFHGFLLALTWEFPHSLPVAARNLVSWSQFYGFLLALTCEFPHFLPIAARSIGFLEPIPRKRLGFLAFLDPILLGFFDLAFCFTWSSQVPCPRRT